MATYAGFTAAGIPGGIIATLGLVFPSLIIILIVSGFLQKFRQSKIVDALFYGLRAASVALITSAMIQVARIALLNHTMADGSVQTFYWPAIILCVVLGFGLYYLAEYVRNAYGYYCEWNKVFSERFFRRVVTVLAEQGPELMFVLFFVLLSMKVKIGNKALAFMGAVTLEFYLIHALFIDLFGFNFFDVVKSLKYIKNVFLYTLVVAACSVPATLLLRKVLHPKQPILPPVKG
jgi:hypothetical protein